MNEHSNPVFSVIITSYHHADYLRQRIDAVLNQDFSSFEVIIIDDHSPDGSRSIIETYRGHPKISHLIYNEINSGSPFIPWEKAMEKTKGKYIWIAECDDDADPQFLTTAYRSLEAHPDAGLYFCNSALIDENGRFLKKTTAEMNNSRFRSNKWSRDYYASGHDELNGYFSFECVPYNVSAAVFRREMYDNIAPSMAVFRYTGDWYFFIHCATLAGVCYSAQPLNHYRQHANSHFFSANRNAAIFKSECFRILMMLYRHPMVKDANHLLKYFAYHHLNFGLIEDGWKKGATFINLYRKLDSRLARKILVNILLIKILRKPPVRNKPL